MTVPFMPFYVADYMADTSHLTTLEHGAYLLLIMNYWQRGAPLPNDDRKLARIAGLGPREWQRVRDTLSEFFQIDCSGWLHSRVESELSTLRSKSLKKRKGGLARAEQMQSERLARVQLLVDTDTDTELPLANAKGAEPVDMDEDARFWTDAKDYLRRRGQKNPGALVGKWVRDHGKAETARALTAAQLERPAEIVPFVEGCFRANGHHPAEWVSPC